jgi:hypothetical protein
MHRLGYPSALQRLAGGLGASGVLAACLSSQDIDLGRNVDASSLVAVDAATFSDDGGGSLPSASITPAKKTICSGECVSLTAQASGGSGPYTFFWDQGLGEGPGPKSVCPAASTTYAVSVGSVGNEQQVTRYAVIMVVACDAGLPPPPSDSGVPPPPPDAGGGPPDAGASLCIMNPSFEGSPMIGISGPPGFQATAAPPQWQVCLGDPDVDPNPMVSTVPASDGNTYVGLEVRSLGFSNSDESVGDTLCAPLVAGAHYAFCIDLGIASTALPNVPGTLPPVLQIWGGKAPCKEDELLWASPQITNKDSWMKFCGSFVPSQALSNLVLIPAAGGTMLGPGQGSYVIVDHIVPGP